MCHKDVLFLKEVIVSRTLHELFHLWICISEEFPFVISWLHVSIPKLSISLQERWVGSQYQWPWHIMKPSHKSYPFRYWESNRVVECFPSISLRIFDDQRRRKIAKWNQFGFCCWRRRPSFGRGALLFQWPSRLHTDLRCTHVHTLRRQTKTN